MHRLPIALLGLTQSGCTMHLIVYDEPDTHERVERYWSMCGGVATDTCHRAFEDVRSAGAKAALATLELGRQEAQKRGDRVGEAWIL